MLDGGANFVSKEHSSIGMLLPPSIATGSWADKSMAPESMILMVAAPFVGSFLGVVAERWPRGEGFILDRSRCLQCRHVLGVRDLVPVASWLASRARCRYCGGHLSVWYPAVEAAAFVVAAWAVAALPAGLIWISVLFGWTLLTLALLDLKALWLPRALTWPLGAAGLMTTGLWNGSFPVDQAIGAVAGYLAMTAVALLYQRYRGEHGLGEGDAHLFGALGAWVGWPGLPSILLFAGASGLLVVLIQMWSGRRIGWRTRMPFGPHLCVGGWLVWLYGPLYLAW